MTIGDPCTEVVGTKLVLILEAKKKIGVRCIINSAFSQTLSAFMDRILRMHKIPSTHALDALARVCEYLDVGSNGLKANKPLNCPVDVPRLSSLQLMESQFLAIVSSLAGSVAMQLADLPLPNDYMPTLNLEDGEWQSPSSIVAFPSYPVCPCFRAKRIP